MGWLEYEPRFVLGQKFKAYFQGAFVAGFVSGSIVFQILDPCHSRLIDYTIFIMQLPQKKAPIAALRFPWNCLVMICFCLILAVDVISNVEKNGNDVLQFCLK